MIRHRGTESAEKSNLSKALRQLFALRDLRSLFE